MAVIGDKDEITAIFCRTADNKYTKLAALVNCKISALGKNVINEYFVVEMWLDGRLGLLCRPNPILKCLSSYFVKNNPIFFYFFMF